MRLSRLLLLALATSALSVSGSARAQAPRGLTVFGGLGGGGAVSGSESDATRGGIFEAEAGAGLELSGGLRPEVALTLGLSPRSSLGLRPGVRWALEGLPFHARGALDFAAPGGSWRLRWLLVGGGAEVRVTDQLGLFAEADLGIPIASKAGLAFLFRAGTSFRF